MLLSFREELHLLYANLQGLQAAARQLLFHDGQRELPVCPSALPVLRFSRSHQPASVRGPLYPHSQLHAELRLPLLSQLQQRPQTGYDFHSSVRQVNSQTPPPPPLKRYNRNVLVLVTDKLFYVFVFQHFLFFGVFSRRNDWSVVVQSCPPRRSFFECRFSHEFK